MISLSLLGSVDLRDGDGKRLDTLLVQPKLMGLLAYLALASRNEPRRRDLLVALFWPDLDSERARSSLRTALHRLRQSVGDAVETTGTEEVAINPSAILCDVVTLRNAHAAGRWADVVNTWRGEFLDGFHAGDDSAGFEQWIGEQRRALRRMVIDAHRRLAEAATMARASDEAVRHAEEATRLDPLDETCMRLLMRACSQAGNRARALQAYSAFHARLAAEMGVEPSGETIALADRIRRDDPFTPAAPGESAAAAPQPRREWGASRWALVAVAVIATALIVRGIPGVERRASDSLAAGARAFVEINAKAIRPMSHMSVAYDPSRHVALVFGGASSDMLFDDVFVVRDNDGGVDNSVLLAVNGPRPQARWMHSAVFDSSAGGMLVFGGGLGHSSPCANDTWQLDPVRDGAASWRRLSPAGDPPSPRGDHAAAWIEPARRMVVFGGHDCVATRMRDTWMLELAADRRTMQWTRLETTSLAPPARSNHSMVYDAARDRMLVFGGVSTDHAVLGDLWILDRASTARPAWRQASIIGATALARQSHRAAWDPASNAMIVFGGIGGQPAAFNNDVWLLREDPSGGFRWVQLEGDGARPAPRGSVGMVYDSDRDLLTILGGESAGAAYSDLWRLVNVTGRLVRAR